MADFITQKSLAGDRGHVDTERETAISTVKAFDEVIDSMTRLHTTVLPRLMPLPEFWEPLGAQQQHGVHDQQKPDGDRLKHGGQKQDGDQQKRDSSDVNQLRRPEMSANAGADLVDIKEEVAHRLEANGALDLGSGSCNASTSRERLLVQIGSTLDMSNTCQTRHCFNVLAIAWAPAGALLLLQRLALQDQIRARMRSSVFQALLAPAGPEADSPRRRQQRPPAVLAAVVADFLQRAELDMTRQVFLREARLAPAGGDDLVRRIESWIGAADADRPLLERLVAAARRRASAA
ncbi:unnamed protein product [Prorocentrum cordatum]|uniref:LisH domain-containing protein n=1 Tax=Prorocentrum cordatum TaxID=2364126 RepID=A0ABN9XZC5_9DINO|nr:unnamed protein product [Polarella glacialis]